MWDGWIEMSTGSNAISEVIENSFLASPLVAHTRGSMFTRTDPERSVLTPNQDRFIMRSQ